MAIGKAGVSINIEKLSIKLGDSYIFQNGKINSNYNESETADYMKNDNILIEVDILDGLKNFTAYTMDLSKNILRLTQTIEVNY